MSDNNNGNPRVWKVRDAKFRDEMKRRRKANAERRAAREAASE